ncbi:hypothetical protein BDK51DRAFT_22687, partial [Blyttiomyces helicus]
DTTKQLSIKKLPPVLSIQLKRFEHTAQASKIESIVRIPAELDMTPYTTRGLCPAAILIATCCSDGIPAHRYSLFAVVKHVGSLETGHYTAFAKSRGEWYAFDDHTVIQAREAEVLETNTYMAFYIREVPEFSPSMANEARPAAESEPPAAAASGSSQPL